MQNLKKRVDALEKSINDPKEYEFTVFPRDDGEGRYYVAFPSENVTRDGKHALTDPSGVGRSPLEAISKLVAEIARR